MAYKTRIVKPDEETVSYWLSIGDLMASILIIFILLFITRTVQANNMLMQKEEYIQELSSVKNKIIAKLKNEFDKEDMRIDIDPTSGAIKIDEKILFNSGEYKLKEEGKRYLKEFVPVYVGILLGDDEIKNEVSQIIIEGHTDDVGTYIYNMDLSQKRAYEVVQFIYMEMGDFKYKEDLKRYITANGRSMMNPVIDKTTNSIDREKSRRVQFLFKLKEDELLKKISEQIKGGIN